MVVGQSSGGGESSGRSEQPTAACGARSCRRRGACAPAILLHWLAALGAGLGVGVEPGAGLRAVAHALLPVRQHVAGGGRVLHLAARKAEALPARAVDLGGGRGGKTGHGSGGRECITEPEGELHGSIARGRPALLLPAPAALRARPPTHLTVQLLGPDGVAAVRHRGAPLDALVVVHVRLWGLVGGWRWWWREQQGSAGQRSAGQGLTPGGQRARARETGPGRAQMHGGRGRPPSQRGRRSRQAGRATPHHFCTHTHTHTQPPTHPAGTAHTWPAAPCCPPSAA